MPPRQRIACCAWLWAVPPVGVHVQAMSVMKRGMPPAGVNPVPIKVAVPAAHASSPAKQHGLQPDVATLASAEPIKQGKICHLPG